MADARPPLSIGLPVYNGQAFLPAALDSLLNQTCGDFELILSDNGSTDLTEAICQDYARRDPRIRYSRQPANRGAVWNFNHVVRLARGDFFKWAAHDDVCLPDFLQRCLDALRRHPEAVLSFPRTALIDAHGRPLAERPPGYREEAGLEQPRPHQRLRELLLHRVWVHEIFGLIRRQALLATRLLPRYVGGEKVLFAQLALQGTFRQIPETLFLSRWHPAQASWIADAADERRWRDPQAPRLALLPRHLQCAVGQLDALLRAPIGLAEQGRCTLAVAHWVCQFPKWRRVFRDYLRGVGSGGPPLDNARAHDGVGQGHPDGFRSHSA